MPRDPRTYITVHDGLPDHPKIEQLDDAAFRALIGLWCWCSRNKTDGFITQTSWDRRVPEAVAKQLLDAGLAHASEGGVQMHDYTEHQRTAAEIEELQNKRSEAGRRGGLAKAAKSVASAKASAVANAKQTGGKPVADTDTETEEKSRGARKRGTRLPDDWLPGPETRQLIASERPDLDLKAEHQNFCDYWHAKAGKDAIKLNWDLTWRRWMRNQDRRGGRSQQQSQPVRSYEPPPPPDEADLDWDEIGEAS